MDYGHNLLVALPEVILSLGAITLMMCAAYGGDKASRWIGWAAVIFFIVAVFASLNPQGDAFGGLYRADNFSAFAKVLIYSGAAVAVVLAPDYFERNGDRLRAEYPVLIMLSAVGAGMMVSASDLLTLYVGLELQSLSSYVLASFMRRDNRSAEAGLKYFVLGALASGILLYGITLLYGFTGTTQFDAIALAFGGEVSTGLLFGLVFVLAGVAFKIAAVPFHMWTPDVYEGAPTPVTTLFASVQKVAAVALMVRVTVEAMGPAYEAWRQIVIFSALASIVLGAVAAIGQTNIKRLLAYSSINNVGFALIGLAAVQPGQPDGVAAVMTYMAIYIVMTLGSFLVVLQMRDADGRNVETIASLSGLSRTSPGLALALAIFMFSLAGIPPLLGFWSKFVVFDAAVRAGLWPLAAIGIATSVIGAYYYLKIVKTMYFDEPAPAYRPVDNKVEGGLIAISALAMSPLGYFLIPALGIVSVNAARALF
ncbi:NADH-quinone oxidoreductase subunit NuoN [Sphingomonas sp.]|jgi:NADH-quinone oxidoreductase subunit N|uniref:NADH-quinone oxidoreductase subunit NuoN n=1 Tax=Sphingomonas sp. TaxID=28214 RepID=UPI002DF3D2B7|nr:NADH-quinone oxidoreductase subunit NuoN [Sphingomonas sp.]HEV2568394.1 NADH-quinone oxidoreductase subunit NuoN [Sphingomonas sp.]